MRIARLFLLRFGAAFLFVGGVFFSASASAAPGDEHWDATFGLQTLNGEVRAIAVDGTNVYVGGYFNMAAGKVVNGVARWDGRAWHDLGGGVAGIVEAIIIISNNVYVGGQFSSAGIVGANNVARWNGSSWSPLSGGVNATVRAFGAGPGGELYAGGDFTTASGVIARRIARWNGSSWSALGSGANDSVYAVAVSGTNVYVGGFFSNVGGVSANGLARWNGSSWSDVGGSVDIGVLALGVSSTNVYAGGFFTEAGGVSTDNIARWSGTGWFAMGSGLNDAVNAIAISGTNVFVAGDFPGTGTSSNFNRVARWNGSSWSGLGSGLNNSASAIAVGGNHVYVGGVFTNAGGKPSMYFARWNPTVASVSVAATDASASEPGPNTGTLTVTRLGSTNAALLVHYTVTGSATAGADYTALSGAVTLPAGASTVTIPVTPLDDAIAECDETVVVTLAPSDNYNVGLPATASVTIADNEPLTVGITASDSIASEPGADTGLFTVTRAGCANASLVVNYTVSGTASPGADYTALSGAVSLPAGAASATIAVNPLDDSVAEGDETVTVTLAAGAYAMDPAASAATVTILDNDVQALVVSPTAITVPEGSTTTFTVTLSAQPATNITVTTMFTSGDADLSVAGGALLTFTPANWNVPQVVTIFAAEDADTLSNPATFTVSSAGLPSKTVTATEADNDTQELLVSTTAITVSEGGTGSFTVRLSAQPLSNVNATVTRTSGDADLSVTGGASLTFTPGNWNAPQTVTIAAAEDDDAANGSAVFTVAASGLTSRTVTATELDNDTQELLVSTTAITVSEGGTGSFTVRLSAQPLSDVGVTVTRTSGDADLSVAGGASLTFTPGNWNVPQTVTIAASEDDDAVNGTATFTVSSSGLPSKTVTATEADNDTQGLVVSPTLLTVSEGGTATFTVRLSAQPTTNTSVTVSRTSGDTDLNVASGTNLIFTPANWNVTQTVTISAAEDDDAFNGSALFTVASSGLPAQTVTASETDNDTQGLVLSTTAITVAEGNSASFTVRLAAQPTNNLSVVTVRASGDTNLTVTGGGSLTFTPANWSTPQPVTLHASEDDDAANGSAVFTVSSAGLPDQTVTATEADNDTLSLVVSTTALTVLEGGTNSFTVRLNAQPTNDVLVTTARTSGDTNLTVTGGASLTFTPLNWAVPQTVAIAAAEDEDAANGSAVFTVSSSGLPNKTVTATEADNDTLGLVVSPTAITVPEGGTATFSVRLSADPISDLTVTTARTSGDTDLSVSGGGTLTFSTANWDVPQMVTIAAAQDDDAANGSAVFTVSSAGLPDQTVTATEADNDTQGLVVSATAITVLEGGTNSFTVRLNAQPTNDVLVTTARTSGDTNLTVTGGASLTFTPGNWNTPQPVTIAAAEDEDAANGSAVFTVSSSGLPNKTVTATEADNDTQGLVVSPTALTVSEGGTATFSVRLSAQPLANLTVSTSRTSGDTDLNVAGGGSLIFTPANWNQTQLVTIHAAEDDDTVNGAAVFTVTSTGLPSQTVTASEADNDTMLLIVSTTAVTVPEGGTATFTVRLGAQPTNNVSVTTSRTSGDTDLGLTGGANLTFTPANWNVPQPVTLAAAEDADAVNSSAVFTVASAGLPGETITATEQDNDTLGLTVSATAVVVPEGNLATFTVRLSAQPTNTIAVTVSRTGGDPDLSVTGGANLTFTAANWNVPQTVTINASEDDDAVNGSASITVSSAALPDQLVTATEADNDTQGLVVSPTAVTVPEGGGVAFTVRLNAQPTNNVTVTTSRTSGDSSLTVVSGANLTFTPANWNQTQNVSLAAAEDDDAINGNALFSVSSAELTSRTVTATEIDNDTQGLLVSAASILVAEGSTTTFSVRLSAQPTNNVTVTVARTSGDPDLSLTGGASLTFTPGNWNVPQSVSISATEDDDPTDGTAAFTVASEGLLSRTVTAAEVDNDVQGLVVSARAITVPEGATATFTVRLSALPASPVGVTVTRASGDTDLSVESGATLTFTSANWNQPQTVTIRAAEDSDALAGGAEFAVASAGLPAELVTATEAENDSLGLVLSSSAITVPEGGSASFTVKLSAQPVSDLVVSTLRASGDADLSVTGGGTLVFIPANWDVAQPVTISAGVDADATNGSAIFEVAAAGLPTVQVSVAEADAEIFVPLAGTYDGLIQSDPATHALAGSFQLKLKSNGGYSMKMLLGGAKYSLNGQLGPLGHGSGAIARPGISPLQINLHLNTTGGTDQITGTLTDGGPLSAQLLGNRQVFDGASRPAPQAGAYTLLIPADSQNPDPLLPQGDGSATLVVDTRGHVKLKGVLGDGTPIRHKGAVSKYGTWPFYALLNRGAGSICGWITFTNVVGVSDFHGTLNWFKNPSPGHTYYPAGFALESPAFGSRYAAPPPGTPATGFANALITLGHGNLASNIVKRALVDERGGVTVLDIGEDRLVIKIKAASGEFKGRFIHPVHGASSALTGVIFQKQNLGAGHFLGIHQTGFVTIEPRSP